MKRIAAFVLCGLVLATLLSSCYASRKNGCPTVGNRSGKVRGL